MRAKRFVVTVDKNEFEVVLNHNDDKSLTISIDGKDHQVHASQGEAGAWSLISDHRQWLAQVNKLKNDHWRVQGLFGDTQVEVADPRWKRLAQIASKGKDSQTGEKICSPMPGKVVKLLVDEGSKVVQGQGIVVVEAMKMENELKASADGVVKSIKAVAGQAVESGEVLVEIGPPAENQE